MRIISLCLSLSLVIISLCGCLPTMFFGAASTATSTVAEERGLGGALSDSSIKAQINMRWTSQNAKLLTLVEITVREGRVLLSGTVDTPEQQIDAIRLTWEVSGVREVIDKIEVGGGTGVWGYMGDSWITTKMRTNMLPDKEVRSVNYTIKTVKGTLYIMGVALSAKELERVLTLGRNISGVQKVISYVRIKEKPTSGNTPSPEVGEDGPKNEEGNGATPEAVSVEKLDSPNTTSSFDEG